MPQIDVVEVDVAGRAAAEEAAAAAASAAAAEASADLAVAAAGPLQERTIAGTTYTIDPEDLGRLLRFSSSSDVTVTLPGTIERGFHCLAVQEGSGRVTFATGSGATRKNVFSYFRTLGADAVASLIVSANADDASAVWRVGGDVGV